MGLISSKEEAISPTPIISVRSANASDAQAFVRLMKTRIIAVGGVSSKLTAAKYKQDGFGDNPAFSALVAEIQNEIVGCAVYFPGYDANRATRGIYLSELYVDHKWRRLGVGRALIIGTARACKHLGGEWMFWSVLKRNKGARKFYKTIVSELSEVVLCAAIGDSFRRLSD